MKSAQFHHQVAIITGASSGIGRALALQLAGQGAKVVLAARRVDLLEDVATACRLAGGEALAVPTDVIDEAQCKALVEEAVTTFGGADLLVNSAGLAVVALLEDFPNLRLFKHTMETNFYGAVHCTYYALPCLKQRRGRIVAISSLGGKAPLPYNTPHIASKFAMHGFFDALRMELAPHGVSVTIICPSWVATGFHEAQMDKDGVPKGPSGRAVYSKKTMTAERCAAITLRAAERQRREVLMGPGTLAAWLRLLAPGVVDWIAVHVFLKAAARRVTKNAPQGRPDYRIESAPGPQHCLEEAGMSETPCRDLSGVAETLRITLYLRAMESQHPDALIRDEKAVNLVRSLVLRLRDRFPGVELVFDAYSPIHVSRSNLQLSVTKFGAVIRWGLRRGPAVEGWAEGIRLFDEWGFFSVPVPRLALI
jgi:short-subunit dehydrogenase